MLQNAPTGVPWSIIPVPKANSAQQLAEQTNVLWRATNIVDTYCRQPLRSTLSVDTLSGPGGGRLGVDSAGVGTAVCHRWPVTEILGGRVSRRAAIPRAWSAVPVSAMALKDPPITAYGTTVEGASGAGGNAVLLAPGIVAWNAGRAGYVVELAYINGWPHAGLTAAAVEGATTLAVDDVTGFTNASAFVYDGSNTETVNVTAVAATNPIVLPTGALAQSGPGTLTLAEPLAVDHTSEVVVSALPHDVAWATILCATAQVLESGITSISIQTVQGAETTGGKGVEELKSEYELLLEDYRRRS
jgi:hypothetical protein